MLNRVETVTRRAIAAYKKDAKRIRDMTKYRTRYLWELRCDFKRTCRIDRESALKLARFTLNQIEVASFLEFDKAA